VPLQFYFIAPQKIEVPSKVGYGEPGDIGTTGSKGLSRNGLSLNGEVASATF